jgi:hypothetical protein
VSEPRGLETVTGVVTMLAFVAFVVDIFTEGGIRRAIRARLVSADPDTTAPGPQVFGVASGAEAILKREEML